MKFYKLSQNSILFCFHHHMYSIPNSVTSLVAAAYELVVSLSISGEDGGGRQESFGGVRQQGGGKEEVVQGSRNLRRIGGSV
ncbi:hypothetical protein Droror1_Dr00000573 [Drosera rotundifolia]